jgi:hypothetical protein
MKKILHLMIADKITADENRSQKGTEFYNINAFFGKGKTGQQL